MKKQKESKTPIYIQCGASISEGLKELLEQLPGDQYEMCTDLPESEYFLRAQGNTLGFPRVDQPDLFWSFEKEWKTLELKKHHSARGPLAKSLGKLKGRGEIQVVDATFGAGSDSLLLLSFGLKVMAFEKNPYIYALALDGLRRACENPQMQAAFEGNLQLIGPMDSRDYPWEGESSPQILYYDPMYPDTHKKKSLPRKEIQALRVLVSEDQEEERFLSWARMHFSRVIVKRSLKAPPIGEGRECTFKGKNTRYDLYL